MPLSSSSARSRLTTAASISAGEFDDAVARTAQGDDEQDRLVIEKSDGPREAAKGHRRRDGGPYKGNDRGPKGPRSGGGDFKKGGKPGNFAKAKKPHRKGSKPFGKPGGGYQGKTNPKPRP